MKIEKIFENEFFVFVDKAAMVLTTPSREGDRDARPCLGLDLQKQMNRQIFPVHRLDFEVSGLVMFAKTPEAHSQANTWFEKKHVVKTYQAVTEGQSFEHIPPQVANTRKLFTPEIDQEFVWKCLLLRGKKRSYEHPTGKNSETVAIYKGLQNSWHRWQVQPLTGRSHQLRYELSRHGFPIIGDELYGSKQQWTSAGIALRAHRLDFAQEANAAKWDLPPSLEISGLWQK